MFRLLRDGYFFINHRRQLVSLPSTTSTTELPTSTTTIHPLRPPSTGSKAGYPRLRERLSVTKVSIPSQTFPSLPLHFDSPTIFAITFIPIETSYPSIAGLRENLSTIVIRYHIVASFDISYSAIACSRAYLVILVLHIWLRLNKNSGKEEKEQKKTSKQERKIKAYKQRVSIKDTCA